MKELAALTLIFYAASFISYFRSDKEPRVVDGPLAVSSMVGFMALAIWVVLA
jgi:hypothetical protein